MATDPVLRMLGLARRAGKLATATSWCARRASTTDPLCVHCGDAGANAAKKPHFTPIRRMFRA